MRAQMMTIRWDVFHRSHTFSATCTHEDMKNPTHCKRLKSVCCWWSKKGCTVLESVELKSQIWDGMRVERSLLFNPVTAKEGLIKENKTSQALFIYHVLDEGRRVCSSNC